MKRLTVGIIAHVDAGKTTLAESMLYLTGSIRRQGRVDHRDTFLDTHSLERERGITIFSKQAVIEKGEYRITLLDTPGHVDFSAEAERVFSILDCAILVISASEGVQAHTETLWFLLRKYKVPAFIFVTKTDITDRTDDSLREELSSSFGDGIVDFSVEKNADFLEHVAMTDEKTLDGFMERGTVSDDEIRSLVGEGKLFPCYFGSGLKNKGVDALLEGLTEYAPVKEYGDVFGARVYKIEHDKSGARLTHIKVTGGSLSVRESVEYTPDGTDEPLEEKITGIRVYSGTKYETPEEVTAGDICALTGLTATYAGEGLGFEPDERAHYLDPVLNYRMAFPKGTDLKAVLPKLRVIEEEEPLLHIVYNERFGEIHAQLMGQVQTEVLTEIIKERLNTDVTFDGGRILYKETVSAAVEGVGHFEPLRHYAEVHVLIEPAERGSGMTFATAVSENSLSRNWQRLILTHLEEKQHKGTLTGSPLTDVKITLVAGRAHIKHTEGGDFRQATYRAVRQGLMFSRAAGCCVLLEPYYDFTLTVPAECVGRAIADIIARHGRFEQHDSGVDTVVIVGEAPVALFSDYAKEVAAYTRGKGKLSCRTGKYLPCHNAEEVIASIGYEPEVDIRNTPDSVFCSHGAGVVIPWHMVREYMHLEGIEMPDGEDRAAEAREIRKNIDIDEKELEAIMEREFGPIKRREYGKPKEQSFLPNVKEKKYKRSLYIIDGYNVIFAWDELKSIADDDLETARRQLSSILSNYQAFTKREMIVVFDAYNVKGAVERKFDEEGLHIVYTKEGELGDTYIEKLIDSIGRDFNVRVVTSDALIQLQAVRSGVLRLSAREFRDEIIAVDKEIVEILNKLKNKKR